MILERDIVGKYVSLVSVLPDDAKVTLEMRLNKEKTKFLHYVDNDLKKQKDWISLQNKREGDFFFLIYNQRKTMSFGTCGIYDIKESVRHIGRLLSYGSALETFEAYYLLINFCFEELHLSRIWGDTDINNKSAYNFTKLFGFSYDLPLKDEELERMVCICNLNKTMFENSGVRKLIYRDR